MSSNVIIYINGSAGLTPMTWAKLQAIPPVDIVRGGDYRSDGAEVATLSFRSGSLSCEERAYQNMSGGTWSLYTIAYCTCSVS
jgi:hypothetical protein